jgi:tetratricopeptide (TPR) repeat protein
MIRSSLFTRSALGLALALGLAAGGLAVSAPAEAQSKKKEKAPAAPKITPTKAFIPAYNALKTALDAAGKRPDVVAARANVTTAETAHRASRGTKPRAEAKAAYDTTVAALGTTLAPEKGLLDAAYAVVGNADDKFLAGQMGLILGNLAVDKVMQRKGLLAMIESGKLPAADVAKYNFYVGGLSYDMRDFAAARSAFQAAIAAGYTEGGVEGLLAEAYINDNQTLEGLKVLQSAAAKADAPEALLRRGVVVAYRAKLANEAASFGSQLVAGYPNNDNWALTVAVIRDLNKFQSQEQIDLLRLMERTRSFAEARDYVEYIQAADPRRLPGEVLKIVNLGLASGKLSASDIFVSDAKATSSGRIAADKASLPGLEREARAGPASAATIMAAGDAFLSYDDPSKAEALYLIAMNKPGVDMPRVMTRLGIAQTDLGKYAEAQTTFAKVTGERAQIAQLWSAYAKGKARAATAVAAAPAQ